MADVKENVTREEFLHWRNYSIGGYLILAIASVAGIMALTQRFDNAIRVDIKNAATIQCEEFVIPAINNFNEKVLTDIENFKNNFAVGKETIDEYKKLIIDDLTVEDCVKQFGF